MAPPPAPGIRVARDPDTDDVAGRSVALALPDGRLEQFMAGEPGLADLVAGVAAEREFLRGPVHARFALARATVAAGRDHGPAIELARAARAGYVTLGPGYAEPVAAIDAWLAAHRR